MLYDPKWEIKTRIFSLDGLVAWLLRQEASASYDYMDCEGECLFGQYMTAHGYDWHKEVKGSRCFENPRLREFKKFVYDRIARAQPHTFAAALNRARAANSAQQ